MCIAVCLCTSNAIFVCIWVLLLLSPLFVLVVVLVIFVWSGFCFSLVASFLYFSTILSSSYTAHSMRTYGEWDGGIKRNTNTAIHRMEYYTYAASMHLIFKKLLLLLFRSPSHHHKTFMLTIRNYTHLHSQRGRDAYMSH